MCGTLCRGEMFVIRLVVHERTTYKETPIAKPTFAQPNHRPNLNIVGSHQLTLTHRHDLSG